ncbi:hypothetical protein [Desulfonatronum thiodismutans]|uniref:hypothetical protein n=1 Tax=Desulfonatronum thiodismutans TaxID=159290 RepID=UPI0004ABD64E|nr:hypothetical protein [Desulfonatronum thiodismutans]
MDEEVYIASSFWRDLAVEIEEFGAMGSLHLLTLDYLFRLGLDEEYADALRELVTGDVNESMIVSVFLSALKTHAEGASLSRSAKRYISWHDKQHKPGRKLRKQVVDICSGISF